MTRRRFVPLLLLGLLLAGAPAAASEHPVLGLEAAEPHAWVEPGGTAAFHVALSNPTDDILRVFVTAQEERAAEDPDVPLSTLVTPSSWILAPGERQDVLVEVATRNDTPSGPRSIRVDAASPDDPSMSNATTLLVYVSFRTVMVEPAPEPEWRSEEPAWTPPPNGTEPTFWNGTEASPEPWRPTPWAGSERYRFSVSVLTPRATAPQGGPSSTIEVRLDNHGLEGLVFMRAVGPDDGSLYFDSHQLGMGRGMRLAENASQTLYFSLGVSAGSVRGEHPVRLMFFMDEDSADVQEGRLVLEVTAPERDTARMADVRAAPPAGPVEVEAGNRTRVEVAFSNRGGAPRTVELGVARVHADGTRPGVDAPLEGYSAEWRGSRTFTLGPGATVRRGFEVAAPPGAPPGERLLLSYWYTVEGAGASVPPVGSVEAVVVAAPPPAPQRAADEPVAATAPVDGPRDETPPEAPAPGPGSRMLTAVTDAASRYPLAFGGAGVGLGLLGLGALLRRESWRYAALAGLLPLYTRLSKPKLLDHAAREELHRLIRQEPGIHYSALQEKTGLNTGALVHHLRTLERHKMILSRREGPLRRFYPVGDGPLPPVQVAAATPMQARVLALLDEGPLTQRELAERLGLSQQGANHHVKTLQRKGMLVLEDEGGVTRCHRVHAFQVKP